MIEHYEHSLCFLKVPYFMFTGGGKFYESVCVCVCVMPPRKHTPMCLWMSLNDSVCVEVSLLCAYFCFYELSGGARSPGYEKESQRGVSV